MPRTVPLSRGVDSIAKARKVAPRMPEEHLEIGPCVINNTGSGNSVHITDRAKVMEYLESKIAETEELMGGGFADRLDHGIVKRHPAGEIREHIAGGLIEVGRLATLKRSTVMTAQEYLDPVKFPLTTQGGQYGKLTLDQQTMIDAFNHDQMAEGKENDRLFSPEEEARFLELKTKVAAFPQLKLSLADGTRMSTPNTSPTPPQPSEVQSVGKGGIIHTPNSPHALTPEEWARVLQEDANQQQYRKDWEAADNQPEPPPTAVSRQ